jgi:hypothetical protein
MWTCRARSKCFVHAVAALPLTICASSFARASDSGFYFGMDLGVTQYPNNEAVHLPSDLLLTGSGSDLDNEDYAWAVAAGYRFNRYVAVEAGYMDLGETSGSLADEANAIPAVARFSLATSGPTLALVGTWPLGNWEPYLRVGILFADTDLSFSGSSATAPFSGRASERTEEMFGGIGLGYRVSEHWRARVELTFFNDAATATTGFTYRF